VTFYTPSLSATLVMRLDTFVSTKVIILKFAHVQLDNNCDFTLPEGSVLLIGSLSHLMEEGLVGYAKSLGAEYRRFSKLFDYMVHIIPFVPPPHGGTNDPDLVTNLYHITNWLDRVQRWNLTPYNAILCGNRRAQG